MVQIQFPDGAFPSAACHVALTKFLADTQTLQLPDVLEDLRSSANLRYQARSLLEQIGQKMIWHPHLSVQVTNRS